MSSGGQNHLTVVIATSKWSERCMSPLVGALGLVGAAVMAVTMGGTMCPNSFYDSCLPVCQPLELNLVF